VFRAPQAAAPAVAVGGAAELVRVANELKNILCPIPAVEIRPTRKSKPNVWAARKILQGVQGA